ncbi:MAG: uracil-DNA glycosylase family protein [Bacteroidota bacterium]
MNTFADRILHFYKNLQPEFKLPEGVEMMHPFKRREAWRLLSAFYKKFYSDNMPRTYIFGINPGRFGGGVTGIPFTDPLRLQEMCGIEHNLPHKPELSSDFIYRFIAAFGGVKYFYQHFFLTAICPLGFTQHGKNLNYYDSKELFHNAKSFIETTLKAQVKAGALQETAFCLGEGVNMKYFTLLNEELQLFKHIEPLPHPRWVMQYRRSKMEEYIKLYKDKLELHVK